MGVRIVRMSRELLETLLTEGNAIPNRPGQVFVTKGVPAGARLEDISMAPYFDQDQIALKFSHQSWPDQPGGAVIPVIEVEFAQVDAGSGAFPFDPQTLSRKAG